MPLEKFNSDETIIALLSRAISLDTSMTERSL